MAVLTMAVLTMAYTCLVGYSLSYTYYGRTYYGRTYYGLHLLRGVLLQRVRLAALHAVEGRLGLARPEELRADLSRVEAR
eukprot:scaffold60726_cov42-Phaeocystis_antarctica.AAC.2